MRNGQTWGRTLSVLEGFGAAQCVTLWVKEIVRIGAAAIYVDNAGFVFACGNGTSRFEYVYTMAGMGVNIKLFHTGRRTTAGERICDALSKGEFSEMRQGMSDGKDISGRASKVLLRWINDPKVTGSLGRLGLQCLDSTLVFVVCSVLANTNQSTEINLRQAKENHHLGHSKPYSFPFLIPAPLHV